MSDPISDFFYKWTPEQRADAYAKALEASTEEMQRIANFDLPEPDQTAPAKPRIHNAGDSVCSACEG